MLLVVGSVVAELNGDDGGHVPGSALGYFFVLCSCFASSTGGVLTEKLLKGKSDAETIRSTGRIFNCTFSGYCSAGSRLS